jgi:hypothetical protein
MMSITESTGLNRFFWNNVRELRSPASPGVIYEIDNSYTGLLQETERNCAIPPEAIVPLLKIGAALMTGI